MCTTQRCLLALALLFLGGCTTAAELRERAFSPERLARDARSLADPALGGRKALSPGGLKARALIVKAFDEMGLPPLAGRGRLHDFERGVNVLGALSGAGALADQVVIVGAHYDHLGKKGDKVFHGANDNASGVAVLLAAARAMTALPPPGPRRTVLFVAFDTEEQGMLGSKAFVADGVVPRDRIAAMLNLDMLGVPAHRALGNVVFVLGLEKSPQLVRLFDRSEPTSEGFEAVRMGIHLTEETPMGRMRWGDYAPFQDARVPFAFASTGLTPTYHLPTDTADTLRAPLMAAAARWVERFVRLVATDPARSSWVGTREDTAHDLAALIRLLERALEPAGGFNHRPVRPEKLRAHLEQLKRARDAGTTTSPELLSEMRRATLRLNCYANCPGGLFSRMCNMF